MVRFLTRDLRKNVTRSEKVSCDLHRHMAFFQIMWHFFSDHVLKIEPPSMQISNGGFTTPVILIVTHMCKNMFFPRRIGVFSTMHAWQRCMYLLAVKLSSLQHFPHWFTVAKCHLWFYLLLTSFTHQFCVKFYFNGWYLPRLKCELAVGGWTGPGQAGLTADENTQIVTL